MSVDGMLEVAFVTWGNVATLLALLITIISGYMVVAYTAAAKMTRQQVTLINIIYLLMGGFGLCNGHRRACDNGFSWRYCLRHNLCVWLCHDWFTKIHVGYSAPQDQVIAVW